MFKQLFIVLLIAGVVLCNEAEQQQQQQEQAEVPTTPAKTKTSLGKSLLDLAIIGSKNAKRTYDDSKPTLSLIKNSLVNRFEKIRNNPTLKKQVDVIANNPNVQKGLDVGKKQVESISNKIVSNPQVQAATAKALPLIQQGKAQLGKIVSDVDSKGRELTGKILAEHNARQEALKNGQLVDESDEEAKPAAQEEQQQQ